MPRRKRTEPEAEKPAEGGWDSANQVAISPSANPENHLRSEQEVRDGVGE